MATAYEEMHAMHAHAYMILAEKVADLEREKETFILMTVQRDEEAAKLREQIAELEGHITALIAGESLEVRPGR